MELVTVVIPVYRSNLFPDEEISFRRTLSVLGTYPITLLCPDNLDVESFRRIAEEYNIPLKEERFDYSFFKDIQGYNRLLLSSCFYRRFLLYEFILICQLDAYVFSDELEKWCKKGFDYIGAPLIGHPQNTEFSKEMKVGNGGFSLRKTQAFIRFFQAKRNVLSPAQISRYIGLSNKFYTRVWVWLLMCFGWHNKPMSVASGWKFNEDDFWSCFLYGTFYQLNIPDVKEALSFSFERFPSKLFEMNNHRLPFGCHAWKKYEYNSFWRPFIIPE